MMSGPAQRRLRTGGCGSWAPPAGGVDDGAAGSGGIEVPSLPAPAGIVGLGGECGQRGVVAGESAAEPTGFTCATFAQTLRESAEGRLVVKVGAGFEAVAGCVAVFGQLAAEVARDLFGELALGVLDGDDVRRAEDAEHERAAAGVVQSAGGQRGRAGALSASPSPAPLTSAGDTAS